MVNKAVFVVVIDDEAIVLETMKLLLQRSGFEVLAAFYKAGTDAIRLVRNFAGKSIPGIIITGDTSSRIVQDV